MATQTSEPGERKSDFRPKWTWVSVRQIAESSQKATYVRSTHRYFSGQDSSSNSAFASFGWRNLRSMS